GPDQFRADYRNPGTNLVILHENNFEELFKVDYQGGGTVQSVEDIGALVDEEVQTAVSELTLIGGSTSFRMSNSSVDADHDLTFTAYNPDGTETSITKRCDAAAAWAKGD